MVGIYKYENGLRFTGKVCKSHEDAERYLGNKYGREYPYPVKFENGEWVYENRFVPGYNKDAFKILEVEMVE